MFFSKSLDSIYFFTKTHILKKYPWLKPALHHLEFIIQVCPTFWKCPFMWLCISTVMTFFVKATILLDFLWLAKTGT